MDYMNKLEIDYSKNDDYIVIAKRIAIKLKKCKDLDLHSLIYIEGRIDQMLDTHK